MSLPAAGTTPPTQVAGEDHRPPLAAAVKLAGAVDVTLISSIAAAP